MFNWYEMHCEGKLKLRSHNTSYCLIEVVTKAGLTVPMQSVHKTGLTVVVNSTTIRSWPWRPITHDSNLSRRSLKITYKRYTDSANKVSHQNFYFTLYMYKKMYICTQIFTHVQDKNHLNDYQNDHSNYHEYWWSIEPSVS
jgi:hypothetical protein